MAETAHELVTIRISHYNEKARWALDRLGVPYRERGYMPFLHGPPVLRAVRGASDAGADHMSSRLSTPVLVRGDGPAICDSGRILRWANERYAGPDEDLLPDEASRELEARWSRVLGEHTRRLAYFWLVDDSRAVRSLARANVGPIQALLFALVMPFGRALLKKGLRVDAEHAAESRQVVRDEVAFASEALGGKPFLTADRFTAADLTLACMLSPVLLVAPEEGYGAVLPRVKDAHPDAAAFAGEMRATPAGTHAMRMFREERTKPGR